MQTCSKQQHFEYRLEHYCRRMHVYKKIKKIDLRFEPSTTTLVQLSRKVYDYIPGYRSGTRVSQFCVCNSIVCTPPSKSFDPFLPPIHTKTVANLATSTIIPWLKSDETGL